MSSHPEDSEESVHSESSHSNNSSVNDSFSRAPVDDQVPSEEPLPYERPEDNLVALTLFEMGFSEPQVKTVNDLGIQDPAEAIEFLMNELRIECIGSSSCPICSTEFADHNELRVPECLHPFCRTCMGQYLELKIDESQVLSIMCPMDSCRTELTKSFISAHISEPHKEKYARFVRTERLNLNANLRWCPVPDCQGYDIGNLRRQKLVCNACAGEFCYYCGERWHGKEKCKEGNDRKLDEWSKGKGVKLCPNCKRRVEKLDGCDHMTCAKCRYEWCWLCGQRYYVGHFSECEYKQFQKKNPPLYFVFAMLFAPAIFPFGLIVLFIYSIENLVHEGRNRLANRFARKRYLSYPAAIVGGLVLTPFCAVVAPFVAGMLLMHEWCGYHNSVCIKVTEVLFGVLLAPFVIIAALISLVVAHIVGWVYVVVKIYIVIRKCSDPTYMTFQNYANF